MLWNPRLTAAPHASARTWLPNLDSERGSYPDSTLRGHPLVVTTLDHTFDRAKELKDGSSPGWWFSTLPTFRRPSKFYKSLFQSYLSYVWTSHRSWRIWKRTCDQEHWTGQYLSSVPHLRQVGTQSKIYHSSGHIDSIRHIYYASVLCRTGSIEHVLLFGKHRANATGQHGWLDSLLHDLYVI